MELLILRHGEAEPASSAGADMDRQLTADGVARMTAQAKAMKRMGLRPAVILSSPYARALQTAQIVGKALGAPIEEADGLGCGCTLSDLATILEPYMSRKSVMVVGHEPDCSISIGTLTGGGRVRMKKGSLACVEAHEIAPGRGRLEFLLAPAQILK